MSLNIKSEHVHDLVRTAADRTGLSQTSVVERALTELLARLDAQDSAHHDRVDAILADMRRSVAAGDPRLLDTDDLYDENGLPA